MKITIATERKSVNTLMPRSCFITVSSEGAFFSISESCSGLRESLRLSGLELGLGLKLGSILLLRFVLLWVNFIGEELRNGEANVRSDSRRRKRRKRDPLLVLKVGELIFFVGRGGEVEAKSSGFRRLCCCWLLLLLLVR